MNYSKVLKQLVLEGLNPLGIGEGFELSIIDYLIGFMRLNPLGIGEGFEHGMKN